MSAEDPQLEARFAELLTEYERALCRGSRPHEPDLSDMDLSEIESDAELAAEWDGAKACLELLARVRPHWSPLAVDATPASWHTSSLDTPPSAAISTLGRFQIVRELGRGGLGIVYLAFDPQLGRHVALKIPPPETLPSPDLRRRFVDEKNALTQLSHPHLVTVHEAGEVDSTCYVAAEFCSGPTLSEWLRVRREPVSAEAAARITMNLALAVQHAHDRGVLHRDIKPSNVIMSSAASSRASYDVPIELCPKLTDLGMSRLMRRSEGQTHSGAFLGAAADTAPEPAGGDGPEIDARADIHALGSILYELLTLRRVHGGKKEIEALTGVLSTEPAPPRKLRIDIPLDLEAITLKCLAKRPADRYTTAGELAEDLRHFLASEPTAARPLSGIAKVGTWPGVVRRWCRSWLRLQ